LTSPLEVPVTVPVGDALVVGAQSVLIAELEDVAFVEGDMPLEVAPELAILPFAATRPAAESALVDAVTPVPLAPFVAFGPVKRCSGFVAELRAESVATPEVELEPGLIVVADE
jgi:hypothetical protein